MTNPDTRGKLKICVNKHEDGGFAVIYYMHECDPLIFTEEKVRVFREVLPGEITITREELLFEFNDMYYSSFSDSEFNLKVKETLVRLFGTEEEK